MILPGAADAWKRDVHHSTPDGTGGTGVTAVLASACEIDSILQEVMGLCTALPDCEPELMAIGVNILTTYLHNATGVLTTLLSNSPVEALMGRPELLCVLRNDPLYHLIKERQAER